MTPFLSMMTAAGHDLVARVRDARTADDFGALIEHYKKLTVTALVECHAVLSDADDFAFGCALARHSPGNARQRAACWDAAALTALRAGAHMEALAVLEKAEVLTRSKERQERMRLIRELLVARGDLPTEPSKERSKRARRPRPSVQT